MGAEDSTAIFHPSGSVTPFMASETPPEVHPAGGMNRWTLEPLLIGLAWILALASAFLATVLAAAGLGGALAVVVIILPWAAAAWVWSRVRGVRNLR